MLINSSLWITLIIIACLALIMLMAFLWKKMKKKPVAGGTIGFFLSFILAAFMFVTPSNVYIVHGKKEYSKYVLLGETSYEMENGGGSVTLTNAMAECDLINDSGENIVIEEVIYGFGFPDNVLLESGNSVHLERSNINHFFDDIPPETIETSSTATAVVSLWVQMEEDFYGDFGGFDFDGLRETLEESIEEGDE
ncbi:MAG: hypothetical protein MI810_03390 [Flavobacteriales bacterium]|nr:hypothetical protein [Flavobacteriales bacterium]